LNQATYSTIASLLSCVRVGRVGRPQRVGDGHGDRGVVHALGALAHLRRRSQQPRPAREAQHALARRVDAPQRQTGRSFLWPSPTNGDSAISRRIAVSSSWSAITPSGPGRRCGAAALGSERLLCRRRWSHAADLDTPATRQTPASGASSRPVTFSASATEGADRPRPAAPWRHRGPSRARRSCAVRRPADAPRSAPAVTSGPRGRPAGTPHATS
jgi:hypothetical protein